MKGIEIWTGLRLISLDDMVREFSVLGITRNGMIQLCRILGVRIIHIGNDSYVEYYRFVLHFSALVTEGTDHIFLPKDRMPRTRLKPSVQEIHSMEVVLREMAACRAIALKKSIPILSDELKDAAERWATAALRAQRATFAPPAGHEISLDSEG